MTRHALALALLASSAAADGPTGRPDPCVPTDTFADRVMAIDSLLSREEAEQMAWVQQAWNEAHGCGIRTAFWAGLTDLERIRLAWGHQPKGHHGGEVQVVPVAAVPLPAPVALLGAALVGLWVRRRRLRSGTSGSSP